MLLGRFSGEFEDVNCSRMMPADTSSTSVLVCGVMIERCMRFVIEEIQGLYMDTVILLSSGVFSGKNKHKNPNKVRRTCV